MINTHRPFTKTCAALCWLAVAVPVLASAPAVGAPASSETGVQRAARMKWWREARLGLFIHWGPVSLTGLEISWSRANSNTNCPNQGPTPVAVYDELYGRFNPTHFDASEWMSLARDAGAKYAVFTAKHCDGFLNWASQLDPYNIAHTPFQRDVCAELARAARRADLRLGWYFSPMDWRDPDFRTERNAAFLARMQAQLRELLSRKGRLDLMWFDWDGGVPLYDQRDTYDLVQSLHPRIIINNRLDLGVGNNDNQILNAQADYYTPEQRIGHYDDQTSWETCMTLGTQWAWKPGDTLKSATEVVGILARTVGGDGNLLLNVGPMPDGRIEPRQAAVLRQLGAWLKQNGKSIYATRGGPYKPSPALASTRRGNVVYLHLLAQTGQTLKLPGLPRKVHRSRWLTGGAVPFAQTDSAITLTLGQPEPETLPRVVRLTLDGPAEAIPARELPGPASPSPN